MILHNKTSRLGFYKLSKAEFLAQTTSQSRKSRSFSRYYTVTCSHFVLKIGITVFVIDTNRKLWVIYRP